MEKRKQMVAEELLSFRKHFWPHHFPIDARFYQFGSVEPSPALTTRRICSAQELRAFQDELTRREAAHEWSFIAYYEPTVSA